VLRLTTSINTPDSNGYYGEFGGAFIPEILRPNILELITKYKNIIRSSSFQERFQKLLKDYVGRPTPLFLAKSISEELATNVFLKREDLCHTGAHKINNALGQALLAKELGRKRIIAETGAGQHGVATATVSALLGMQCQIYMGAIDIERQAPNVARMKFLGAEVVPVESGSKTLKDATNEAMRDWIANPSDTHYIIGSVVGPHPFPDMVAHFQSVISKEIRQQLKNVINQELPSHVIACVGGGSNAIGAFYHFLDEKSVKLIGVEAAGEGLNSGKSAATLALGKPGVLHGSRTIVMQNQDGQIEEAHSISAGLDYPGIGPLHAHLAEIKRVEYVSITDQEALLAAKKIAELEGIIPALESAHAFAELFKRRFGKQDNIILSLSGRGDKDMSTYAKMSSD
jgi:tryptophan synthase beta chain